MQNISFSEDTFIHIIKTIRAYGYECRRFDSFVNNGVDDEGRTLLLRHDVDISPPAALRLGQIEQRLGVCANFFFQINADTYSFFSSNNRLIMEELRKMGHCVGLHIDELLIGADEAKLLLTLEWVHCCGMSVEPVISFHRPTPGVLGRRYSGIISTYDSRVFHPSHYCSDSRRSLQFVEDLLSWMKQKRAKIQLLLHPEWWHEVESMAEFLNLLRERRRNELEQYLLNNFAKVFGGHISHENRSFGL